MYTKAVDVKAQVDAVQADVNDPTGAAAAGVPGLIAWAAPAQVARARRVVDSLPTPPAHPD